MYTNIHKLIGAIDHQWYTYWHVSRKVNKRRPEKQRETWDQEQIMDPWSCKLAKLTALLRYHRSPVLVHSKCPPKTDQNKTELLCKISAQHIAFVVMGGYYAFMSDLAVMRGTVWNWWNGQREAHALHSWVRNEKTMFISNTIPLSSLISVSWGLLTPLFSGPGASIYHHTCTLKLGATELGVKFTHKSNHARATEEQRNATEETIKKARFEEMKYEHAYVQQIIMI